MIDAVTILAEINIDDEPTLIIASNLFNRSKEELRINVLKARDVLANKRTTPGMMHLNFVVSKYFGMVPHEVLQRKTRKREFIIPKHVTMYIAHKIYNYSQESVAEFYGLKEHSTVVNAYKRVEDLMFTDKKFKTDVEEVINQILTKDYETKETKQREDTE